MSGSGSGSDATKEMLVLFVVCCFSQKFSPFRYGSERRKLEEQNKSKNGINIKGQDNRTDSETVDEETD